MNLMAGWMEDYDLCYTQRGIKSSQGWDWRRQMDKASTSPAEDSGVAIVEVLELQNFFKTNPFIGEKALP